MEASSYLKVVRNRLGVILLTVVIAVVVMAVSSINAPRVYEATTKLRIVPFGTNAPDYGTFIYFDRLVNTYSSILTSDELMNRAKQQLGMDKLPDYNVALIPQTELMQISVQDQIPDRAALVANTLVQLLIEQNQSTYISDDNELRSLLRGRLDELRIQIGNLVSERNAVVQQRWLFSERLDDINEELASLGQAYNAVLNTYNQTIVAQSVMASAINVIEAAVPPEEPLPSNFTRNLVLAGSAGLIGGLVLAFLFESRNPSFHTQQQIEAVTQTPIIGRIPHLKRQYRRNVFEGDRMGTEAFRRLRARILRRTHRGTLRSLVVTSALPGEGKTTIAANLAASMAYNGLRVLLVDADLTHANRASTTLLQPTTEKSSSGHERRKSVSAPNLQVKSAALISNKQSKTQDVKVGNREDTENFEHHNAPTRQRHQITPRSTVKVVGKLGLSQLLQGIGDVRDAIQDSNVPNLRVLPAGVETGNSAELLSSDEFHNLLEQLLRHYDAVIFDTPDIQSAADAPIVGQQTDGTLWVVNPAIVSQKAVGFAHNQLEHLNVNVVGIVMNNLSRQDVFQPSQFADHVSERQGHFPTHYETHLPPGYQSVESSGTNHNGTDKHLVD